MFAGRNRIKMFSILIFWILLIHPALGDVNELVQKRGGIIRPSLHWNPKRRLSKKV